MDHPTLNPEPVGVTTRSPPRATSANRTCVGKCKDRLDVRYVTVAGRSARRGDGQGGAGARRRALPARVWRTVARCGFSVWRHHHRESVVGRPEGAQPPNTPGGNTTRGETPHGETHPPTVYVAAPHVG